MIGKHLMVALLASACGCASAPSLPHARAEAPPGRAFCDARGLATTGLVLTTIGASALAAHVPFLVSAGALGEQGALPVLPSVVYQSAGATAGLALLVAGAGALMNAQERMQRERPPAGRCPR